MVFGSFESFCAKSQLPACSLLGPANSLNSASLTPSNPSTGILTTCYARSIELANTIIFQAATDFAHIAALAMTAIMILHVRSKFTAVGRKEILTFFYIYMGLTTVSLVLDAGVIEARPGGVFPFFVAIQNGLASALCTSLLVNGFVGFQLYEDGTTLSVWLLRSTSMGMFVISFAVSLLTFKSVAGLSPTNTTGLFVVLYVINGIFLLVYAIMQTLLVVNTLQDRWPLGDLIFGVFFLVIGQLMLYVFATDICQGVSHYLDGIFFATVCNLLAVMMVYKYWDSITKEDLEFSVGTKQNNWEVKDPLLDPMEERRASVYDNIGAARSSMYDLPAPGNRSSFYEGSLDNYPSSLGSYQQQLQPQPQPQPQSQPQLRPVSHGHSRLSYQESTSEPRQSATAERDQQRLSHGPPTERPRRTDDYYDRNRTVTSDRYER